MELAFGKKYLFQKEIVLILCVNFFINGMRRAVLIFKESMGLFWYDRYKALAEAVLNLVHFDSAGDQISASGRRICRHVCKHGPHLRLGGAVCDLQIPLTEAGIRVFQNVCGVSGSYGICVGRNGRNLLPGIRRTVSADGAENGDLPAGAEPAAVDRLPEDGKMPETDGTAEKNRRKSADGK